ncbi:MAG TPA: phosphoglycerate transporter, partial [Dehalococcoidia bacterium]|nr:phosphoglycerate transporter [Dehalococcoidia bacterium]
MLRVGWLSTGRDQAARDLLKTVWEAMGRGEVKAEIAFVFSNREPGEARESDLFFGLVKGYKISLLTLSSSSFGISGPSRRLEYDRKVMGKLRRFKP